MKTGKQLQQEGIDAVTQHNLPTLQYLRKLACFALIASPEKAISTDQLRIWAKKHKLTPLHKNAWGALFRQKDFVFVERCQSIIPSNHARYINYYRLAKPPTKAGT